MVVRRLTYAGAAACLLTLAACAPKGPSPEAFISSACTEAALAESSAAASMQQHAMLASQVEEHEARLIELQRMRSRIVTGRMSDEELAQWTPERLPWEEPEPEPEPIAPEVETPPAMDSMTADTMATTEYGAEPDTSSASTEFGAEPADTSGYETPEDAYQTGTDTGNALEEGDLETATEPADVGAEAEAATEETMEPSEPSDAGEEPETPAEGAAEESAPEGESAP